VSIPIASNNVKEGVVIPATVTSIDFTVNNWNVPQEVTIKGVDDDVADGDPEYDVVLSKPTTTDVNYAAQDPKDVTLTNVDNDSIGLDIVYPTDAMTSEDPAAPIVSFTVALLSKPKGTVTLPLLSSNENEGIITSPSPASLVFDASNWSIAQRVEVQGVDDLLVDMDAMYSILIGPPQSTDAGYAGLPAKPVKLINLDDDVP
jgi:large repetitive protein